MKHFEIKILFVSYLISSIWYSSFAQFTGGNYCGFATINAACPGAINIFVGGAYDGFAFSNVACPATIFSGGSWDGFCIAGLPCSSPFLGGSHEGFAFASVTCSVSVNIFTGGSYDGFAFSNTACPNPLNIFLGGSYDGFAQNNIACPVPVNIFLGGSYDGFALNSVSCPVLLNIFQGGSYDGFAYSNIACPATIYSGGSWDGFASAGSFCSNPFVGGGYDGFAFNNLACTAPQNVFTGGSYDGFSLNNIACVSVNFFMGGVDDGSAYYAYYTTWPCGNAPLPIGLRYFKAACRSKDVVLNWSTASETNNAYFTLERSTNSTDWEIIGTVNGAGNSTSILNYSFTDFSPFSFGDIQGMKFYTLKQTDFDENSKYSDIISVKNCDEDLSELIVYPNPSTGTFNFSFNGNKNDFRFIEVFNVLGEKIYHSDFYQPTIDLSAHPDGIYFVIVNFIAKVSTKKIVIKR